jgi:acid stress-induced BolA-like protein IbaG/YrbA
MPWLKKKPTVYYLIIRSLNQTDIKALAIKKAAANTWQQLFNYFL